MFPIFNSMSKYMKMGIKAKIKGTTIEKPIPNVSIILIKGACFQPKVWKAL